MSNSTVREPDSGDSPNQPDDKFAADSTETQRGFHQLRDLMDQHFTLEEIQGLCFDLSIEFEHLAGSTRPRKIESLIVYLTQRQRLSDLHRCLEQKRPQVNWDVTEQLARQPQGQLPVVGPTDSVTVVPAYERPSRSPQYLDFEVEVGPGKGREYPVAVIRSPAGEAREKMQFPYDELALENRLQSLQIALLHAGGAHRQMLTPEERLVQEFGRDLFNALLTGETRSRFDVSCTEARTQGKGLRLKLRIQPPELARLPWEFLYDSRRAEYISLSRETPVIRYLELPQSIQPLTVSPPLRILGMTVSPHGLPPLDIEREKQRVDTAVRPLQANGIVQLTWLAGSTWRDLQRAMRAGPWHIFHFIGHGGFDSQADEGFIALTNESGEVHRLMATELGRLLADHHSLRLVLLNSCEGARGSEHDVFSSSAAILVRRGLPAVLAMQYAITDRAAIEFARAFYEALTDNLPVDAAVAEARKAVSLAISYTVEWGTPVLYMRAPQGIIFKIATVPRPASIDLVETDSELEQRLEQLYTDGLGAYWVEDWDKACLRFQKILDIQPDYADTADRLVEAQRQKKLQTLYDQAQAAKDDWGAAITALEEIVADMPDYRDTKALLAAARQQKQLTDLYAEARQLHDAGQWQAVVNVFGQIRGMEPAYPDPDDLLAAAEQQVAELQRQAELSRLYGRAVRQIDAGKWESARQLLATIAEMEPDYRETNELLARAEEAAARAQAEQERQAQINTWYEQALSLARAGQWPQVLAKMQEIAALDPEFVDPESIGKRAKSEMERAEAEAQRQEELAALYAEAVQLLKTQEYQAALRKWQEVQELDAHYPDRQKVQRTAKKKLKQLSQAAAPSRRWPRQRWLWLGGVGVVVTAIAILLILNPFKPEDETQEAAEIFPTSIIVTAVPSTNDEEQEVTEFAPTPTSVTVVPTAAVAASGQCPEITGWQAEYWDNTELQGERVLCRNEYQLTISHSWGYGSPTLNVPKDHFSARFTRTINFAEGRQRFSFSVDDGARLWVDDVLVLDYWEGTSLDHPPTFVDINMNEGDHELRLEYFEIDETAHVNLSWTAVSDCEPGVIYCEDFENGRADNWELWGMKVVEVDSNHVLEGTSETHAFLHHIGWTDYRLRLRLKLKKGQVLLGFRSLYEKFGNYHIGFNDNWQYLHSQLPSGQFTNLQDINESYDLNRWHDIEVVGKGGHIQVYVDGLLLLDYVDDNPILEGSIWFEISDDSEAQIDDIEILPVD